MSRLWGHLRVLWPGPSIHLPLLLTYWAALMGLLGMLHWDHIAVAAAVAALAFFNEKSKSFLNAFVGFAFVAWVYDASRFIRNVGVTPDRTLLCNLHEAEVALFGFQAEGRRQTLQDYFFAHHHLAADVFFAIPYASFLLVTALYAVYLYRRDARACARYGWAFGAMNVLAIITYHVVPSAPPWYFHKFGCVVDAAARSFEGEALARVDAFTHLFYFRGFYGRASEVFGAIPSLHVAYPLLIVIEGWRRHGLFGRLIAIAYWLWMCVAAVYLDHHWVADIVLGWAYTVGVVWAIRRLAPSISAGGASRRAPAGDMGVGLSFEPSINDKAREP